MNDRKDVTVVDRGNTGMPTVVYVLYLVSLINGITALIGLILAYVSRGEAPEWLTGHYTFQIRTFWIGLLLSVIAGLLTLVFIGFVLMPLVAIWFIVRCVRGLIWLNRGEAVPNPESWLLGDAPK